MRGEKIKGQIRELMKELFGDISEDESISIKTSKVKNKISFKDLVNKIENIALPKEKITKEQIEEKYIYCPEEGSPETGYFKFKSTGRWAGSIERKGDGYRSIQLETKQNQKAKSVKEHRCVWLMHNDTIPETIDHKDGNRLNNDISNLRSATRFQNSCNKKKSSETSSKYMGVYWHSTNKNWAASLSIEGVKKTLHLGSFRIEEEAAITRDYYARIHHGEFAFLNFPNINMEYAPLKRGQNKYYGVIYHEGRTKPWGARVYLNKKLIHLAYYEKEIDAAKRVNEFLIEKNYNLHKLNKIEEES